MVLKIFLTVLMIVPIIYAETECGKSESAFERYKSEIGNKLLNINRVGIFF